jgi:hypothetical protein
MRRRRIMAGFRRIGIVLALVLALPLFAGLSTWATLGHPPPSYAYLFLLAGSAPMCSPPRSAGSSSASPA